MRKFRVLKIKLIFVEFFGKIKLKVIINNNNNTNINSLCVVCELVCLFRRVCMRVLEAKRESASFVSIFFPFRLLYLPHLLCLERAPHFLRSLHPLPLFIQTTSLDYHAEIDKVCCVLCGHLSHFCANRGERGNYNLKRKKT